MQSADDGVAVGMAVVGVAEGAGEGIGDGARVGRGTGAGEGSAVGTRDGARDGDDVGVRRAGLVVLLRRAAQPRREVRHLVVRHARTDHAL